MLLSIVLILGIAALLLWILSYVPMDPRTKTTLNIAIAILAIVLVIIVALRPSLISN